MFFWKFSGDAGDYVGGTISKILAFALSVQAVYKKGKKNLQTLSKLLVMLDLTDLCYHLSIPDDRDPYYCRGEGIHQRQFISEDERLSWDESRGSYSRLAVWENTHTNTGKPNPTALKRPIKTSCLPLLSTAQHRADGVEKGESKAVASGLLQIV